MARLRALLPADPATQLLLLVAGWALTRAVLVSVSLARDSLYPAQEDVYDLLAFEQWGPAFARGEGEVPLRDGPWEYPAAAAVLVVLPSLLRGAPYRVVFVAVALLLDLALLLLLWSVARRRGSLAGPWLWLLAVPALGPVALARFDLVPTLLAVGGLVAGGAAPLTAGVLLGTGAAVKVWPVLLGPVVLALHGARLRVLAGGAAVAAAVLGALAAYGGLDQALSFLDYQQDRGLQVESVPALPLMLARVGDPEGYDVSFAFGSYQVDGPGAELLLRLADLGLLAVVALVAWLTWRARRAADRTQATVVLAVVLLSGVLLFDKVLSAQYPLWLAGLVALALCWSRSPLVGTAVPLLGLLALTHGVYPLHFQDLLTGEAGAVQALLVRDLLLLAVFAQATWAAWQLPSASEDEVPVDEQQPEQAEARG